MGEYLTGTHVLVCPVPAWQILACTKRIQAAFAGLARHVLMFFTGQVVVVSTTPKFKFK